MLYLFGKPSKRAFRRCMGWGGGGGQETIFLRKLPVIVHTWSENSLFPGLVANYTDAGTCTGRLEVLNKCRTVGTS